MTRETRTMAESVRRWENSASHTSNEVITAMMTSVSVTQAIRD